MMSRRGDAKALAERLQSMGFLFWVLDAEEGRTPISMADLMTLQHGDVWISRSQPETRRAAA